MNIFNPPKSQRGATIGAKTMAATDKEKLSDAVNQIVDLQMTIADHRLRLEFLEAHAQSGYIAMKPKPKPGERVEMPEDWKP